MLTREGEDGVRVMREDRALEPDRNHIVRAGGRKHARQRGKILGVNYESDKNPNIYVHTYICIRLVRLNNPFFFLKNRSRSKIFGFSIQGTVAV